MRHKRVGHTIHLEVIGVSGISALTPKENMISQVSAVVGISRNRKTVQSKPSRPIQKKINESYSAIWTQKKGVIGYSDALTWDTRLQENGENYEKKIFQVSIGLIRGTEEVLIGLSSITLVGPILETQLDLPVYRIDSTNAHKITLEANPSRASGRSYKWDHQNFICTHDPIFGPTYGMNGPTSKMRHEYGVVSDTSLRVRVTCLPTQDFILFNQIDNKSSENESIFNHPQNGRRKCGKEYGDQTISHHPQLNSSSGLKDRYETGRKGVLRVRAHRRVLSESDIGNGRNMLPTDLQSSHEDRLNRDFRFVDSNVNLIETRKRHSSIDIGDEQNIPQAQLQISREEQTSYASRQVCSNSDIGNDRIMHPTDLQSSHEDRLNRDFRFVDSNVNLIETRKRHSSIDIGDVQNFPQAQLQISREEQTSYASKRNGDIGNDQNMLPTDLQSSHEDRLNRDSNVNLIETRKGHSNIDIDDVQNISQAQLQTSREEQTNHTSSFKDNNGTGRGRIRANKDVKDVQDIPIEFSQSPDKELSGGSDFKDCNRMLLDRRRLNSNTSAGDVPHVPKAHLQPSREEQLNRGSGLEDRNRIGRRSQHTNIEDIGNVRQITPITHFQSSYEGKLNHDNSSYEKRSVTEMREINSNEINEMRKMHSNIDIGDIQSIDSDSSSENRNGTERKSQYNKVDIGTGHLNDGIDFEDHNGPRRKSKYSNKGSSNVELENRMGRRKYTKPMSKILLNTSLSTKGSRLSSIIPSFSDNSSCVKGSLFKFKPCINEDYDRHKLLSKLTHSTYSSSPQSSTRTEEAGFNIKSFFGNMCNSMNNK